MEMHLMRGRPRWWLALAVAGLALAAVVFAGHPGTASAQEQAVSIQDEAFNPSSIQVTAGTTVVWTNNDSEAHTVTADDGSFDSGLLQPGASFSHTFDTAGTVAYHCTVHSNMTAEVVVLAATSESTAPAVVATAPASSDNGNAAPPASTAASGVSGSTTLPDTGAGTGSGGPHLSLILLAIGVVGILGGAGVMARRRKTVD